MPQPNPSVSRAVSRTDNPPSLSRQVGCCTCRWPKENTSVTAGSWGTGSKETARELAINSKGTGDIFSLSCTPACPACTKPLEPLSACSDALVNQNKQEMDGKGFVRKAQQPKFLYPGAGYPTNNAIPQDLAGKRRERQVFVGEALGDSALHLLLSPCQHFNSTTRWCYRGETQGLARYMKWKVNNPVTSDF